MDRIKSSVYAGLFYPADKTELTNMIEGFNEITKKEYNFTTRAIIVPHAGYIYSGLLACEGFNYLNKNVKNIFIIAPSHPVVTNTPTLLDFEYYETPLGKIQINQEINKELISEFSCEYRTEAFESEHSVEVQIPLIQHFYKDVKIIPIVINFDEDNKIEQIISKYYADDSNAFVISTDLSHYLNEKDAQRLDTLTATMIELLGTEKISMNQACGRTGICGLVNFTQKNNYSLIRLGMMNSSSVTKDKTSVVGYGAWALYEDISTEFIKKYYKSEVFDICKKAIEAGIYKKNIELGANLPEVFKEYGAAFVTLEKNKQLRGCIGSIVAHQPLLIDLAQHAHDAAFNDKRFSPLTEDELPDISISVSLLSQPTKIEFSNESDLMEQIKPFEDGIIIKDGNYQSVFLPSVWEQLPDKNIFMSHLKIKAGLPPNHFSETFEAFRFSTVYLKDE